MNVPFFRPSITEAEIEEVVATLRSGWLTTGPRSKQFEADFARFVGAKHAVALNSCTAALHLALDAVGLRRGDLVLVPTMTFAATAEVVRYFDATPVMVDCEPRSLCIDVAAARATLVALREDRPTAGLQPPYGRVRAIIPMHYGGQMVDVAGIRALADEFGLAVIDDAAHTLPAFYREHGQAPWRSAGTCADITCFSFYANKCITTGEGGMAVTNDDAYAARIRLMSLHGLSKDAWKRFTAEGSWYYEIAAPGFKYNITDIASAIGLAQLRRAEELWQARRALAAQYRELLADVPGLELPDELSDRQHSWHLFALRVDPTRWRGGRDALIEGLKERGIATSVHWMPLHLHPYYRETYRLGPGLFPVAEQLWQRLVSLPLFPGMRTEEVSAVVDAIKAQSSAQKA
jgi:dTDP-4-amino-4,6-dideoxygalactose transaminase